MFLLITKSTPYLDVIRHLKIDTDKLCSDHLDLMNNLKRKYKYMLIDEFGTLLIVQQGSQIVVNELKIFEYKLCKINLKRNFITSIRKLKLKSVI